MTIFHKTSNGTNKKLALLLVIFGVFFTPAVMFANHRCTGDTDAQPNIDMAAGHNCTPAGSGNVGAGNVGSGITTFDGLIGRANAILNTLVPVLIGLAVFIVIWGVFGYITHADEEEKRAEAKQFILWGVIFIFFMVSIWGFINILVNSFDLSKTAPTARPTLPCIIVPPATSC
ncbi:MAG: hypothetical protein Q7R93_01530 [bacterium]|nr:hypothetical protein [bacterium]